MDAPVLDDSHHGPGDTHVDGLGHIRQEVFLDFEAPLANAPASVHQEGQVHFAVCTIQWRITAYLTKYIFYFM